MTPVLSSPVALLDQLDAAREAAYDEVVRLCRGGDNRWTMSIPARPTVDSDLLIAKALDDHKRLAAVVRAVLALADELDGLVDDETVDEVARVAHGWTLNRIRASLAPVTP